MRIGILAMHDKLEPSYIRSCYPAANLCHCGSSDHALHNHTLAGTFCDGFLKRPLDTVYNFRDDIHGVKLLLHDRLGYTRIERSGNLFFIDSGSDKAPHLFNYAEGLILAGLAQNNSNGVCSVAEGKIILANVGGD